MSEGTAYFVKAPKDYLVGRTEEIKEIREKLKESSILFIDGEDGVGKFETVLSYCKNYQSEYDFIYTVEDCLFSFEEIKDMISSIYNQSLSTEQVRKMFEVAEMKWLFIFKEIGEINPMFYQSFPFTMKKDPDHHMIFVKSKPEALEIKDCPTIVIQPLSQEESKQLFSNLEVSTADESDINDLVSLSKGNPMLIHQLSYYIQRDPKNLKEFLKGQLENSQEKSAKDIYQQLLKIILTEVKSQSTEFSEKLLETLIYFEEFSIHSDWFGHVADFSKEQCESLITILKGYGIIELMPVKKRWENIQRFTIPRYILKALREYYSSRKKEIMEHYCLIMIQLCEVLESIDPIERSFLCRHLFYFIDNVMDVKLLDTVTKARVYTTCLELLFSNAPDALGYGLIAKQLYDRLPLSDPGVKSHKAHLLKLLGMIYAKLQSYEKSLLVLEESKQLYETLPPQDSKAALPTLELNIGFAYLQEEQFKVAIQHFERAMALLSDDTESIDYAKALNNLGVTWCKIGGEKNYKKAIKFHLKAVELFKKHFGDQHMLTLTNYQNIAIAYGVVGDQENSEKYTEILCEKLEELEVNPSVIEQTPKQIQDKVEAIKQANQVIKKSSKKPKKSKSLTLSGLTPTHLLIGGAIVAACVVAANIFSK